MFLTLPSSVETCCSRPSSCSSEVTLKASLLARTRVAAALGLSLPASGAVLLPVAAHTQSSSTPRTKAITATSYDGRSMPAEAVRITVPERRSHPGRSITLAAIRIPTTAAHPGNPIVFLMGGPGIPGSVMLPIPPYFTLFQRLREEGDVIILDQRGIGKSEPVLDCPSQAKPPDSLFLDTDAAVSYLREQIGACAAHWREQGVDPAAYTTLESADDVDDLRQALGYTRIDLLGFSYGTRLALAYLQRHDSHVGRVVLQGVDGPGNEIKSPLAPARKLERIDGMLSKDPAWKPPVDLAAAAREARERLAATPANVTVTDRKAGTPVSLKVGRDGFDLIAALNMNNTRLPALLVSVPAGDDRVLAQLADGAWNDLYAGSTLLMGRAVDCSADRSPARWAAASHQAASAPFGMPIDDMVLADSFCEAVGYKKRAVEFAHPVHSAAPVLLLTGSLDATCPVENAQDVARGLPHAVLLDVVNAQHEALTEPSVQDAVVDFLRGSDVRGRRLIADPPQFLSIDDAARPRQRHGGS